MCADLNVAELRKVVASMNSNASPGPFGLEVDCIKMLLDNDTIADIII
jgi:hypothetical protein